MADVFSALAQDHKDVKRLMAELEQGPAQATGASQDQLARRKKTAPTHAPAPAHARLTWRTQGRRPAAAAADKARDAVTGRGTG